MRITLNDGEGARVLGILHDEPVSRISLLIFPPLYFLHRTRMHSPAQAFLVISVDLGSLLQLGNQLVDGLLVLLGVEVNDECVDHCCGLCCERELIVDWCVVLFEGGVKQLEGGML